MALDFLNPATIRNLLQQGEQWGINVRKRNSKNTGFSNIINIGEIVYEDLLHEGEENDDAIPCYFEEDFEETKRVYSQAVQLEVRPNHFLPETAKVELKSYEIIPSNQTNSRPIISFRDGVTNIRKLDIIAGQTIDFKIVLTLPINYIGSLNRFLVMEFQSFRHINEFSSMLVTFKIGILLVGSVVNKAAHHKALLRNLSLQKLEEVKEEKKQALLSTEAKPFVPLSQMLFFNTKREVCCDEQSLWRTLSYPPNAITCVTPFTNIHLFAEDSPLFLKFLEHQKNHTMQNFLVGFGINQLNEVLLQQSVGSIDIKAYLSVLQKLNHLEDMTGSVEHMKYDLHFLSMTFALYGSDIYEQQHSIISAIVSPLTSFEDHFSSFYLFQCVLKVKGSSELRPKILVGNRIRLRPTVKDCQQYSIPAIEFVGLIIHYTLSTENVVIVISVPKTSLRINALASFNPNAPYPTNAAITSPTSSSHALGASSQAIGNHHTSSLSQQSLQLWSSLKYHLRFVEEKSLFSFINYLLYYKLPTNHYLLRCFFPTPLEIQSLQQLKLSLLRTGRQPRLEIQHSPQLNRQQRKAIEEVLYWCGIDRPSVDSLVLPALPMPPFIFFGPAGTGKTSVVIETIMAILQHFPHKRILACAPSEAAADVIALRLVDKQLSATALHRFNWWQRILSSVPPKLFPHCHQYQNLFELHSLEKLLSYQVIVTTCQATGSFFAYEQHLGFDVVIVDEASQATEGETFLPLSFTKPGGIMILAGDIHQLGPQTKFPYYQDCIPFVSFQERLLHLPYYASCLPEYFSSSKPPSSSMMKTISNSSSHSVSRHNNSSTSISNHPVLKPPPNLPPPSPATSSSSLSASDEVVLGVFLNQNYRSHPSILAVSSQLFYHRQLIACGEETLLNRCQSWSYIKDHPQDPMVFIDVQGQHDHEMDSPSYYNDLEVTKVVEVCQSIVNENLVPPREIGVIAAFRKQVLKIRQALRAVGLHSVNVGGVEDFQGQEVMVIIISTVLTAPVPQFMNEKGSFGLMNDARRFNVSITRGVSLCVVIGNQQFLSLDPYWKYYLEGCSNLRLSSSSPQLEGKHHTPSHIDKTLLSSSIAKESEDEATEAFFRTVDEMIQQIFSNE